MDPAQLEQLHSEIFSNLTDYALVKTKGPAGYTIYNIAMQGWVVVEEYYEDLIALMLQRGVQVVNDVNEVRKNDFVRYVMKWDDEKKAFVKVPLSK